MRGGVRPPPLASCRPVPNAKGNLYRWGGRFSRSAAENAAARFRRNASPSSWSESRRPQFVLGWSRAEEEGQARPAPASRSQARTGARHAQDRHAVGRGGEEVAGEEEAARGVAEAGRRTRVNCMRVELTTEQA